MALKLNIVIEKDRDGYYAFCPDLEGCQSEGETLDEAMSHIREAIELYLETMTQEEIAALSGREILTGTVEVEVG